MKRCNMETHDFYCLICGNRSLALPRKMSHKHEKFHRKKLYCPYCKTVSNNIEISSEEDRLEFLNDYQKGVYNNERENIISYGGLSRVR